MKYTLDVIERVTLKLPPDDFDFNAMVWLWNHDYDVVEHTTFVRKRPRQPPGPDNPTLYRRYVGERKLRRSRTRTVADGD